MLRLMIFSAVWLAVCMIYDEVVIALTIWTQLLSFTLQLLVCTILVESLLDIIITSKQIKITSYLFFAILLSSTKCTLFLSVGVGLILVVISTYISQYFSIFSQNSERFVYQMSNSGAQYLENDISFLKCKSNELFLKVENKHLLLAFLKVQLHSTGKEII